MKEVKLDEASGTLTKEMLEDAFRSLLTNQGAPDRFIFNSHDVAFFRNIFARSEKWQKLKAEIPGLPDEITNEQAVQITSKEKKLAKILYG